jgi:pyrroline-5-carboxylate reductase
LSADKHAGTLTFMPQAATEHPPLVIVGGGTMARAIIQGAESANALDPRRIALAEPLAERRASLQSWVGSLHSGVADAAAWLAATEASPGEGQILLAVKPQSFGRVAEELAPALGPSRVVTSIMAGVSSRRVREMLGDGARVVRVMPNTPAQIRRGMSAIARGAGSVPGDEQMAERIFAAVGQTVSIPESMMDAYTALAGSGPAYVFFLAEAMVRAAGQMGFERADALRIVRETIAGAGLLLAETRAEPGALREAVTSKGGTTAAAVAVLDAAGAGEAVCRAVIAARDRGAELGGDAAG